MKHLFERGVIVLNILEEPLLGELWVGQGLCEGLHMNLHEVVVLGLRTCEEVGVVSGVHLLSGEVRSVSTALKVVEEVQEEVQEIKDEWDEKKVEGNGGLKVEEKRSSCDDHEMMRTSETWATVWYVIMTTRTWLTKTNWRTARTFTSRVNVRVLCVEGAQGLGGHVVIGVVSFYHAYAIPIVEFFPSGCCSSCCSQTVFCDRQFHL